jgi:3-oxoacyl-[acyl-carrier-protein] synthase-3
MRTVLGYADYYLPGNYLSIDEYVELLDDSFLLEIGMNRNDLAGILKNSIGLHSIYVEERKNEVNIFGEILERYFLKTRTNPGEIDFIIYTRGDSVAEGNPWSMIDERCTNIPYFLQKEFKMGNAQVFNVEQVCSGTLVAARIAFSFIETGSARKILVLSSNFFQDPRNRLMGGLGLVSDSIAIMEISTADTGLEILDFAGVTDGNITMVKDFRTGDIPAVMVNVGADLIKSLLKKNNLTLNDIAMIIPQNISKSGWTFYCQVLEFPKERVFLDNFDDGGHMGDVDIIRNITEIRKRKLLKPRDFAVIYGIGTGTSWNALLVRAMKQ